MQSHLKRASIVILVLIVASHLVACEKHSDPIDLGDTPNRNGSRETEDQARSNKKIAQANGSTMPRSPSRAPSISGERSEKLSSRLSPQAKREVLLSPPDKVVSALVSISSSVDRSRFTQSITQIGGQVVSWSDTTNVVTLNVPASTLNAVADMNGVVYVETGGRYSP